MLAGEIIEVSKYKRFSISEKREFIAMTSNNKFLCWNDDKTCAIAWEYGRETDQLKELKECEVLGARFECKSSRSEWGDIGEPGPLWLDGTEYRIKDGITPEQFKKHPKEIIAWWDGAEIEYLSSIDDTWKSPLDNEPTWGVNNTYRIKEIKTVYEWIYQKYDKGSWCIDQVLRTEKEATNHFGFVKHKKTGRSFEI